MIISTQKNLRVPECGQKHFAHVNAIKAKIVWSRRNALLAKTVEFVG